MHNSWRSQSPLLYGESLGMFTEQVRPPLPTTHFIVTHSYHTHACTHQGKCPVLPVGTGLHLARKPFFVYWMVTYIPLSLLHLFLPGRAEREAATVPGAASSWTPANWRTILSPFPSRQTSRSINRWEATILHAQSVCEVPCQPSYYQTGPKCTYESTALSCVHAYTAAYT